MNGMIDTDRIRSIFEELLEIERERLSIMEDISDIKTELKAKLGGNVKLASAIIKIFDRKDMNEETANAYETASRILGIETVCERYVPKEANEQELELRNIVLEVLKRYQNLVVLRNEYNTNIKDVMGKAKACGLSTVCLKKILDWKLNPQKYNLFIEMNPLLEVYQEKLLIEA